MINKTIKVSDSLDSKVLEKLDNYDGYNEIVSNILYRDLDREIGSICITSPSASYVQGEVTFNLAKSYCECMKEVLIINFDCLNDKFYKKIEFSNSILNMDSLSSITSLEKMIFKVEKQLNILDLSSYSDKTIKSLLPFRINEILEEFKEKFDLIIINAPSISETSDGLIMSKMTEGLVLIGEANKYSKKELLNIRKKINDYMCDVLGMIFVDLK